MKAGGGRGEGEGNEEGEGHGENAQERESGEREDSTLRGVSGMPGVNDDEDDDKKFLQYQAMKRRRDEERDDFDEASSESDQQTHKQTLNWVHRKEEKRKRKEEEEDKRRKGIVSKRAKAAAEEERERRRRRRAGILASSTDSVSVLFGPGRPAASGADLCRRLVEALFTICPLSECLETSLSSSASSSAVPLRVQQTVCVCCIRIVHALVLACGEAFVSAALGQMLPYLTQCLDLEDEALGEGKREKSEEERGREQIYYAARDLKGAIEEVRGEPLDEFLL